MFLIIILNLSHISLLELPLLCQILKCLIFLLIFFIWILHKLLQVLDIRLLKVVIVGWLEGIRIIDLVISVLPMSRYLLVHVIFNVYNIDSIVHILVN